MNAKVETLLTMSVIIALAVFADGVRSDLSAQCLTCTSEQKCEEGLSPMGGGGSSCLMHVHEGQIWCQWEGSCDPSQMVSATRVSPAGTILDSRVVASEGGVALSVCSELVVRHAPVLEQERRSPVIATLRARAEE